MIRLLDHQSIYLPRDLHRSTWTASHHNPPFWKTWTANHKRLETHNPCTRDMHFVQNRHIFLFIYFFPFIAPWIATTAHDGGLPRVLCVEGQFACRSFGCVDSAQVCDGKQDCLDGSDEEHCGKYGNSVRGQTSGRTLKTLILMILTSHQCFPQIFSVSVAH